MSAGRDSPDLRLIVITDAQLCAPRDLIDIVDAALAAGAPAIQLRDKTASARDLLELATALRERTRRGRALLFVNDRLDVALAAGTDGVHLGPHDLPVDAVRAAAPPPFLIGCSADTPQDAVAAQRGGADYIGCGAVFGTTSKPDAAGERIGVERLAEVVHSVSIPVVGIGGIDASNVGLVAAAGAAGAAVIRSVMTAAEPGSVVREIMRAFDFGERRG